MRIAQLAPLVESVPPKGYGGTELVVNLLTEELVKNAHDVTLFATGDSITSAKLVSIIPEGLRASQDNFRHRWNTYDVRSILTLKKMQDQFDIIHNHMGFMALPFLSEFKTPVVTTNHNNIVPYCQDIYFEYANMPFVAISQAYKNLNFPDKMNYAEVVYNGIDLDDYVLPKNLRISRDYLLFIGRISKAKGTADAIDIAIELGLPIKVAGKVDATDISYYEEHIKDRLKHPLVDYIGEATKDQKAQLYAGAKAVVYPIDFDEPFGLVMAEALAMGTPVMAYDRGSVCEIIKDKEVGIVGNTKQELIDRYPEIELISEKACMKRAKENFSKERMAKHYLDVFQKLVVGSGTKRIYQFTN
ncbi:glycosyltransferase family 4 protein [bacterium]|nr:glycosyltransferase family 4 protein [bacterium]QQR58018.1 MAG: glycosyltransferase family 4 protein [Candidatus Melainabacteria bacterium]